MNAFILLPKSGNTLFCLLSFLFNIKINDSLRYFLKLRVIDETDSVTVIFFDQYARVLLGRSCDQVYDSWIQVHSKCEFLLYPFRFWSFTELLKWTSSITRSNYNDDLFLVLASMTGSRKRLHPNWTVRTKGKGMLDQNSMRRYPRRSLPTTIPCKKHIWWTWYNRPLPT